MEHRAAAVTSRALELALRGQVFSVKDLQATLSNPPSRQTCYRVLRQLQEDDWIRLEGNTWHPDFKTEAVANVNGGADRGPSISADDVF